MESRRFAAGFGHPDAAVATAYPRFQSKVNSSDVDQPENKSEASVAVVARSFRLWGVPSRGLAAGATKASQGLSQLSKA